MKPADAIKLLTNATRQMKLSYEEHVGLQQAIDLLTLVNNEFQILKQKEIQKKELPAIPPTQAEKAES